MLGGLGHLQPHRGRYQLAEKPDQELRRFDAALDRQHQLLGVRLEDRVAGQALQAHLGTGLQRERRQPCLTALPEVAIDTSRKPSRWHSARR